MPLGGPLLEALERMRCGGIILSGSGEVMRLNAAAEGYLQKYAAFNPVYGGDGERTRALRRILGNRKGLTADDADVWVPITDTDGPQLVVYSRRVATEEGALTVITLVDLSEPPLPSVATLEKLFGLSPAETRLAVEIARGLTPNEAAEALGIKMATVRSQLSSIFAKTGTERQGELVALLARLAVLP